MNGPIASPAASSSSSASEHGDDETDDETETDDADEDAPPPPPPPPGKFTKRQLEYLDRQYVKLDPNPRDESTINIIGFGLDKICHVIGVSVRNRVR